MWTPPRGDAPPAHGRECSSQCNEQVANVVLTGPQAIRCPYCGAAPAASCRTMIGRHLLLPLRRFGPYHPSRVEAA